MQSSGLTTFDSFVALGCSSQSFFLPFHRPFESKTRASIKIEALFLYSAFPVFTRSLNSFVRATKSKIHLHSVTLRKLRFSSFQKYYCLSPYDFSAVAPMPSSWGFAPLSFCTQIRNAMLLLLFSQRNALSIPHHFAKATFCSHP